MKKTIRPVSAITDHANKTLEELTTEVYRLESISEVADTISGELTIPDGMNPMLALLNKGREIPTLEQYGIAAISGGTNNVSPQRAVMLKGFYEQREELDACDIPYRATSVLSLTTTLRAEVTAPKGSIYRGEIQDSSHHYLFYDRQAEMSEIPDDKKIELEREFGTLKAAMEQSTIITRCAVDLRHQHGNTLKHRYHYKINYDNIEKWKYGELDGDIRIMESTSKRKFQGEEYTTYGVNTNVFFSMDKEVEEDPITISEDYAKRCQITSYDTLTLEIPSLSRIITKDVTYDELGNPIDLVRVGEKVKPGAILFGGLTGPSTHLSKVKSEINGVFTLDDEYLRTVNGGIVDSIEIESSFTHKGVDAMFKSPGLKRILHEYGDFKSEIISHYEAIKSQVVNNDVILDAIAHEVYTDALSYHELQTSLYGEKLFLRIKITVKNIRSLAVGDKATTTPASKGMIGTIRPTHLMPIDSDGIRCDAIIPASSVPNRMNPDNIYENELSGATHRLNLYLKSIDQNLSRKDKLILLEKVRVHYNKVMLLSPTDDELLSLLDENLVPMFVDPTNSDTNNILSYDIVRRVQDSPFLPSTTVTDFNTITGEPFEMRGVIGNNYLIILNKSSDDYIAASAVMHNSLLLPHKPPKTLKNKLGFNPKATKALSEVEMILETALKGPEAVQLMRHEATDAETIMQDSINIHNAKNPFLVEYDEELELIPFGNESASILTKSILGSSGRTLIYNEASPISPKDIVNGKEV